MRSTAERAGLYRQRAEELRTIAESWHELSARLVMFSVADEYDLMADRLENRRERFKVVAAA